MQAARVLPLSGVHNFRDYGGYAVEGGGRLRSGMLWRSAQHEAATDDDLAALDALDLDTIPLDDAKTYEIFKRAQTTAIFQFESRGMRDLLKRARPERFEDLIALVDDEIARGRADDVAAMLDALPHWTAKRRA